MNKDRAIGELLREIVNGDGSKFPIMSGKVVPGSVNEDTGYCQVKLSIDVKDAPDTNVIISAVVDNVNGFIIYPADDSFVWVAEIDGGNGKYGLIKCSDIAKIQMNKGVTVFKFINDEIFFNVGDTINFRMRGDAITLNGGSFGGLVKSSVAATKDNFAVADLNTLKGLIGSVLALVIADAAATPTSPVTMYKLGQYLAPLIPYVPATLNVNFAADYENGNITHG